VTWWSEKASLFRVHSVFDANRASASAIRVARRTRRSFYHVKDTMASFTMASMGVSTTVRAVSRDARVPACAFPAHPASSRTR
jgi:hypothetical protein